MSEFEPIPSAPSSQETNESMPASIDPNVLIEQSGDNTGRIAAVERVGITAETDGSIDGLPVIGFNAENESRDLVANREAGKVGYKSFNQIDHDIQKVADEKQTSFNDAKELYYDKAGTDAMVAEVGKRAEALVPNASEEIRVQVREAAESYFRTTLEKRVNERQAKIDEEALGLLAQIQSGENVSGIFDVKEPDNNTPAQNNETL